LIINKLKIEPYFVLTRVQVRHFKDTLFLFKTQILPTLRRQGKNPLMRLRPIISEAHTHLDRHNERHGIVPTTQQARQITPKTCFLHVLGLFLIFLPTAQQARLFTLA
jgi:hypothetical protein